MKIDPSEELLAASDQDIENAVAYADPMLLQGLLNQLTGDDTLVEAPIETISLGNFTATLVTGEAEIAAIREKVADFLKSVRDSGEAVSLGDNDRLMTSLGLAIGAPVPSGMWMEQTALDPWARGLEWHDEPDPFRRSNFRVAVIGTGLSGLNAAVHLKRAGLPFIAFEKNADVGGTWYENRYPGARVDTPSRSYTHLFGTSFPAAIVAQIDRFTGGVDREPFGRQA